MTAVAALLAGLAVAAALAAPRPAHRLVAPARRVTAARAGLSAPVACALGGAGVAVLVGLPLGPVLGVGAALGGPVLLGRLEPAAARRDREHLVAQLPLALDLLAACLSGGASLPAAAAALARAVPGVLRARLMAVSHALAVGTAPADAWQLLGGSSRDDPLAGTARLLARAAEGGTPVSATVTRLAVEARARARAAGSQRARQLGVVIVAPLGLCFLPAFVLLGVVPVVVGLAGPLLATF